MHHKSIRNSVTLPLLSLLLTWGWIACQVCSPGILVYQISLAAVFVNSCWGLAKGKAEITLMFNGNPNKGDYFPIRHTWINLQFEANDIEALSFSPNYRQEIDLDECFKWRDTILNLDNKKTQRRIFNKKRGYMFGQEHKAKNKEKKEGAEGAEVINEKTVDRKRWNDCEKVIKKHWLTLVKMKWLWKRLKIPNVSGWVAHLQIHHL